MSVTKTMENLEADVVVVGGGGSGLVAGVSAAENGAKNVIILEKMGRTGGNAFFGSGMMAVESPAQKRIGEKTTREQVFKEAMEAASWMVNPKIVRAYINQSGKLIGWLESKGLVFEVGAAGPYGGAGKYMLSHGHSKRQLPYAGKIRGTGHGSWDPGTGPGFAGSSVTDLMVKECERLGIKVLTKTPATKILKDSKGKVSGVLAKSGDKEIKITARAVIIAAGNFSANPEMLQKYLHIPQDKDIFLRGTRGETGDGIKMGDEAGAYIDDQFSMHQIGPAHYPWARSVNDVSTRSDLIMVNKNGERFMDESYYPAHSGGKWWITVRQPGGVCYGLLDSALKQAIINEKPDELETSQGEGWRDLLDSELKEEADEGEKVKIANTLEEIAEYIGAKPEVLKTTIERYNSFCDKGHDADYVKDPKFLKPVRTPPYIAIFCRLAMHTIHGGILINEKMEVISKENKVISGLYAAGDGTADWCTANYPHPGTDMAWAFNSGYIAGESAAKFISGK